MRFRVICALATDNWNRNPSNRMTKGAAEKLKIQLDKKCRGPHTVEAIDE